MATVLEWYQSAMIDVPITALLHGHDLGHGRGSHEGLQGSTQLDELSSLPRAMESLAVA